MTNLYAARFSICKLNDGLSPAGYLDLVLRAKPRDDFYAVVRHEGRICWLWGGKAIMYGNVEGGGM